MFARFRNCINIFKNVTKSQRRLYADAKDGLPPNLKKAYELYQRDNDIPIYLKAGFRDRILYIGTVVLVLTSAAHSYYLLLSMAFRRGK